MTTKYIDYLTEDTPIDGQEWFCVSFVSPEKGCSMMAFKIRGFFHTHEQASKHAEKLRKDDPDFDIFVGSTFKWVPYNPDPETIEDEVYQEKELQKLICNYKKSREQAKDQYDERKETMLKETAIAEENKLKKQRNKLKKKMNKQEIVTIDDDVETIMQKITDREKELECKYNELNNERKTILKEEDDIVYIDEMIKKIED